MKDILIHTLKGRGRVRYIQKRSFCEGHIDMHIGGGGGGGVTACCCKLVEEVDRLKHRSLVKEHQNVYSSYYLV